MCKDLGTSRTTAATPEFGQRLQGAVGRSGRRTCHRTQDQVSTKPQLQFVVTARLLLATSTVVLVSGEPEPGLSIPGVGRGHVR